MARPRLTEYRLDEKLKNSTVLVEFYLLPFALSPKNQLVLFFGVLLLYLLAVLGNMIIVILVGLMPQLHTPMYFFLSILSFQDIVYVSSILPKLLAITITGDTRISYTSCLLQMFLLTLCIATEYFLLTSMAYDRYVAICIPLCYSTIMNKHMCLLLVTISWLLSTFASLAFTLMVIDLSFCNIQVNHFFCDPQTMVKITCSDPTSVFIYIIVCGVILGWCPFILILTSYMYIVSTILKIQTTEGRLKTFSSCSSHLIVVFLFYGTSLSVNMNFKNSYEMEKVLSMLYIGVIPLLNPLVYSLRNKEVLKSMKKVFEAFHLGYVI